MAVKIIPKDSRRNAFNMLMYISFWSQPKGFFLGGSCSRPKGAKAQKVPVNTTHFSLMAVKIIPKDSRRNAFMYISFWSQPEGFLRG